MEIGDYRDYCRDPFPRFTKGLPLRSCRIPNPPEENLGLFSNTADDKTPALP